MTRTWGVICLALWLIIAGGVQALGLQFAYLHLVMGLLLVAAGLLILIGK